MGRAKVLNDKMICFKSLKNLKVSNQIEQKTSAKALVLPSCELSIYIQNPTRDHNLIEKHMSAN